MLDGMNVSLGFDQDSKFKISDMGKVFSILVKNMYPEPLKSAVIETVSNSRDAMVAAGRSDKPIFISYDAASSMLFIEDSGTGMSPQFMDEKYIDVGYSSKQKDVDIGRYGIGRLAVLSYVSTYFVETTWNGTRYKYLISSNEMDVPDLNLLESIPTTERNGVKVSWKLDSLDHEELRKIYKEKLIYFPNLIEKNILRPDEKDYKIFDYGLFKSNSFIPQQEVPIANSYRGYAKYKELSILLENVVYPINWSAINIPIMAFPGSIYISLEDSVEATPDRSNLIWTKDTIQLVKTRLLELDKWVLEEYNKTFPKKDNVFTLTQDLKQLNIKIGENNFHYSKLNNFQIKDRYTGPDLSELSGMNGLLYSGIPGFYTTQFKTQRSYISCNSSFSQNAFYDLDPSKLNTYRKAFPHIRFLVFDKEEQKKHLNMYSDLTYTLQKNIEFKYHSGIKDRSEKKKKAILDQYKVILKQGKDFLLEQTNLKASDLILPTKDKKTTERQSRKGQAKAKIITSTNSTNMLWVDLSEYNKKGKFVIGSLDDEYLLKNLSTLTHGRITGIIPSKGHEKRFSNLETLKQHLSSKQYTKFFQRYHHREIVGVPSWKAGENRLCHVISGRKGNKISIQLVPTPEWDSNKNDYWKRNVVYFMEKNKLQKPWREGYSEKVYDNWKKKYEFYNEEIDNYFKNLYKKKYGEIKNRLRHCKCTDTK